MKLSKRGPGNRSLFSELNESFPWDLGLRRETDRARWTPSTDVYATDEKYVFEMDLAGMKKDDVDISIEDDRLTISGERVSESREDDEERKYHRTERYVGRFERSFVLPAGVDADSIKAHYEAGTLTVDVPKPTDADSGKRRISIE